MTDAPTRRIAAQALAAGAAVILAASAVCAWIHPKVKKIAPLDLVSVAWPDESFRDNAYFAEFTEIPAGLTTRGSRKDGVEYRGPFVSGWYVAAPRVSLMVAGFPHLGANSLALETIDTTGKITSIVFSHIDPRDSWRPWNVSLPADAQKFRIRAIDGESGTDGWLAVSEPFEPSILPAVMPQTERALLAFAIQALLLGTIGYAATGCFRGRAAALLDRSFLPLLAGAAVALLGYAAFWIYFAHPLAGRTFSWSVCAAAGVAACWADGAGPARGATIAASCCSRWSLGSFFSRCSCCSNHREFPTPRRIASSKVCHPTTKSRGRLRDGCGTASRRGSSGVTGSAVIVRHSKPAVSCSRGPFCMPWVLMSTRSRPREAFACSCSGCLRPARSPNSWVPRDAKRSRSPRVWPAQACCSSFRFSSGRSCSRRRP